MEYRILKRIQQIGFPRALRIGIAVFFILAGMLFSLIPVIPGTIFVLIGAVMLISGRQVVKVIKIRKGVVYLFKNFSWKRVQHKMRDFKTHIKHIIFHKSSRKK